MYVKHSSSDTHRAFDLKSIFPPKIVRDHPDCGMTRYFPQDGAGGRRAIAEIQFTSPGSYGWILDNAAIDADVDRL